MEIHRTRQVLSLFKRSQLLVSNEIVHRFFNHLHKHTIKQVRYSQLDYSEWKSRILLPEGLNTEYVKEAYGVIGNRDPFIYFAYTLYLDFLRKNKVSFVEQIRMNLFSGYFQQHCFRITGNGFPYYMHKSIQHYVVWLNPNMKFNHEQVNKIQIHLKKYFRAQGHQCIVFENMPANQSMPEVIHLQLIIQH